MAGDEFSEVAEFGTPAGAFAFHAAGGVEAQAGDDREDMAGSRIDRDPAAPPGFSPAEQTFRGGRRIQHSGVVQQEGDGAGAIVTDIEERRVSAAPAIRFSYDRICRPNRVLHRGGCVLGRVGDAVLQDRHIAGDGGVCGGRSRGDGGEAEER